jgi:nicotinate (nicotinamide) nucleotide adenylyltransferase
VKILLFGGTFNPPHLGHIALLENCVRTIKPDEIRILPLGTPPHKAADSTSTEHRIAMCQVFCEILPNCIIDIRETIRPGKSYTADTVQELREKYPDDEFYLCIGSDMFLSFETWHNYEYLLKETILLVHLRDENDIEEVFQQQEKFLNMGIKIIFLQDNFINISSSEIRKMHQEGKNIEPLLHEYVYNYILKHNLYR